MTLIGNLAARMATCAFLLSPGMAASNAAEAAPKQTVIVAVGAEGSEEFREPFRTWAGRWRAAAEKGQAEFHVVGLDPESGVSDRDRLKGLLARHGAASPEPLWLILIGHGTFDGKLARFNLRGPDLSSGELAEIVKPVARPLAIADCSSSSAPFLAELSGRNRVIITATRSGHEYNLARLGDFLSASINDPDGDLDKDGQTSLLEAFLLASNRVQEFYAAESRLATEHSLVDDNGDKLGTPPDWFKGTRAVKTAKDGTPPDGRLAQTFVLVRSEAEARLSPEQRARRDELERQLADVRGKKSSLAEDEYLDLIEPLLLELGTISATALKDAPGDEARLTKPATTP
ncbi:hypothetical protein [Caulifigura coniformis]|nr:hypothetical protein [Caulifigura coniformis]